MVQLVEITNVCDQCHRDERRTEAVESVTVSFESGGYAVDLCADHLADFRRFADWIEEVGRRTGAKKRTRNQPKSVNPCPDCDRVFDSPQGLSAHRRWHSDNDPGKVPCPECDRSFASALAMTNHRRSHRRTEADSVACPECGKQYANRAGLATHIRNAHPADAPGLLPTEVG